MSLSHRIRTLVGRGGATQELLSGLSEGEWPRGGLVRYVCHGLPRDLLDNLKDEIQTLADWDRAFGDAARRYRALGDKATANGDPILASRYYIVAAACAFHGQLLLRDDLRRAAELQHTCRATFRYASEALQPPAHLVHVDYRGAVLKAYVREAEGSRGTVILLNGAHTCKEDMHYFTQSMMDVRLNTVCIDTPGTGEALPELAYTGVEGLWASVKASLADRPRVVSRPMLLFGVGAGAMTALALASAHPREFRAAALLSPPYDLGPVFERIPPWTRTELQQFLGCTASELPRTVGAMNCVRYVDRVSLPVLIAGGGKDVEYPKRQARQLADAFGPKRAEYWGFGRAGHCAYERFPQLRARMAQWLGSKVGVTPSRGAFESNPA